METSFDNAYFQMSTWFKQITEKFKFTCVTGREMILINTLQKTWDAAEDNVPYFYSSVALLWNIAASVKSNTLFIRKN